MYTLNGWWFLSSGGSYPPVFTVETYYTLVYLVLVSASSLVCSIVLPLLVCIFHMVAVILSSQSSYTLLLVSASVHLCVL